MRNVLLCRVELVTPSRARRPVWVRPAGARDRVEDEHTREQIAELTAGHPDGGEYFVDHLGRASTRCR